MLSNSATNSNGVLICELFAMKSECPIIKNLNCQKPEKKINGLCSSAITPKCLKGEILSNGHCCPIGKSWEGGENNGRCQLPICKDGMQYNTEGGVTRCVTKCPGTMVMRNWKCTPRCKTGYKFVSVGCVKQCAKNQHLMAGVCTKNVKRCWGRRSCQRHFMKIIKSVKAKSQQAQELVVQYNSQVAILQSNKRNLQAIQPTQKTTKDLFTLQDDWAVLEVEFIYYRNQIRGCRSASKSCHNGMVCKKQSCGCGPGTKLVNGKCDSVCKPGTKWDTNTKECVNSCKDGQTWTNGKCISNCAEGAKWELNTKRCISVCAVGTKYDLKTKKCITVCQSDEDFTNGKCTRKCPESEDYDETTKKCVSKCSPGTKWNVKTKNCESICKDGWTWKNGVCSFNCSDDKVWKNGKCTDMCTAPQIYVKPGCVIECPKGSYLLLGKCVKE